MEKLNLKILSIIILSFINLTTICARQHSLSSIPDPKKQGQDHFVSNPDGILYNVSVLDEALVELEKQTKVEFAVVVVSNFDENQEDFEFAKALFDKWKIGKAGSNNGLLLLIAKDRRKYRFISGDGVEGLLPDIVLKQIGERQLVPAFRENQYDEGILQAIDAVKDILTNPNANAEIQSLISKEKQKSFDWMFALGVSAVIIFLFIFIFRAVNKQAKKTRHWLSKQKKQLN
ncbi:TPM domain-containing protein [Pedobacter sp. SL55]|uniref:TPM domain-containing protein n=1 Tax=Pedobacter sp. SL55 TaxID=2995161 RepID=UPI00227126A8|nr:TPM domain-containing protein [Pedobacter sp. SL55]WAC39201.1 TPM domain-containing protein [Pedobacter sp. SL55]